MYLHGTWWLWYAFQLSKDKQKLKHYESEFTNLKCNTIDYEVIMDPCVCYTKFYWVMQMSMDCLSVWHHASTVKFPKLINNNIYSNGYCSVVIMIAIGSTYFSVISESIGKVQVIKQSNHSSIYYWGGVLNYYNGSAAWCIIMWFFSHATSGLATGYIVLRQHFMITQSDLLAVQVELCNP